MVDSTEEKTAAEEPRMVCYICKKLSPKSDMVEVEYEKGKTVWVLSKYVKYEQ
ncbi:MAG: hypothetical protein WC966_01560 [Bradymonadales bacterium]|jgi:hypothetical protein